MIPPPPPHPGEITQDNDRIPVEEDQPCRRLAGALDRGGHVVQVLKPEHLQLDSLSCAPPIEAEGGGQEVEMSDLLPSSRGGGAGRMNYSAAGTPRRDTKGGRFRRAL